MAWTVVGWALLGLLALLVLAFVLPCVITVQYSRAGLFVWARLLFVRVRVFPPKPRRAKPKREVPPKKEKPENTKKKPKKEKPPKTMEEKLALVKRLVKASVAAGQVFLRHMRFNGVQVVLPVHSQDASDTALLCARIHGGLGSLRAFLDGRLKLRFKRIQIIPDFTGQLQKELFFACKVAFNPGIICKMGFVFLSLFLRKRPYSKAAYKRALAEKQRSKTGQRAA